MRSTPLENLSPVLDTQRMGIICVQNRLNNIVVDQDHYSNGVLTASDPTAGTIFADSYKPRTAAERFFAIQTSQRCFLDSIFTISGKNIFLSQKNKIRIFI